MRGTKMKLNYKRTIFVGFAFFLICTFWQAYDTIIPKILTDKFGMSQAASGGVMALDNVLAIFLLPLFGAISDKTNTKLGRRTPFIIAGTLAAAIAFVGLSFVDNAQARALNGVERFETAVYGTIADADAQNDDIKGIFDNAVSTVFNNCLNKKLITPNGVEFVVMNEFAIPGDNDRSETEKMISVRDYLAGEAEQTALNAASVAVDRDFFCAIENYYSPVDVDNTDNRLVQPSRLYSEFYVPARQAYAEDISSAGAVRTGLFIAVLLVVLISMAAFRSPAVALMPDVTIKPLRSKANAVINLMGTAGGIIVLALGMIFGTGSVKNSMMSYTPFFAIIAGVMLAALGLFMITVREPKFAEEMRQQSKRLNLDETDEETSGKKRLSKGEKTSLVLILASVALWYMGYNAVTSKYSVYAGKVLNLDYNSTLMIANIAAIVSYIPVGAAASKIGRKKTILGGVVMLASAFGVAAFLREGSSALLMNCMFALAGIGWATINVNSFPMVVEMCSGGEIGKFTGYYYTASMAAQVLTPYLSGLLMDKIGMTSLFPYAACFVALAFAAMLFVKHGDSRPQARSGIEALNYED